MAASKLPRRKILSSVEGNKKHNDPFITINSLHVHFTQVFLFRMNIILMFEVDK